MKKLARIAAILLIPCVLAGCADSKWPTWITGEPDESVLNAPRAVAAPEGQTVPGWPRLASVPGRPKPFSTSGERRKTVERMTGEKTEAEVIRQGIAPRQETP
jgi:hypothetical protein